MKNRLPFLILAAAALVLGQTHAADPPNVILILSDDQGFTETGFMGHKVVRTPNGDDWQEVTVTITASGPLGILRLYLPVQTEPVEIDWIELQGTGAKKRWEF